MEHLEGYLWCGLHINLDTWHKIGLGFENLI